jgi:hypothetical protein
VICDVGGVCGEVGTVVGLVIFSDIGEDVGLFPISIVGYFVD